jgi:hypothetical protein
MTTDLLAQLPRAERRSNLPLESAIRVERVSIGGESHPVLYAHPHSRVSWPVSIPRRATLRTYLALKPDVWDQSPDGAVFTVGISDGRVYELLYSRHVDPRRVPDDRRWVLAEIDLGGYAGWQWSLFYWPSERSWTVIFNTLPGPPAGPADGAWDWAVWGAPAIYAPIGR